jgi:hypothetical protein
MSSVTLEQTNNSKKVIPHLEVSKTDGIYIGFDNNRYLSIGGNIFTLDEDNKINSSQSGRQGSCFHTLLTTEFTIENGIAVYIENQTSFKPYTIYELIGGDKFGAVFITGNTIHHLVFYIFSSFGGDKYSFDQINKYYCKQLGYSIKELGSIKYTP